MHLVRFNYALTIWQLKSCNIRMSCQASFGPELFTEPGDVHFSEAGSAQLAAQVAEHILKAL